MSGQIMTHWPLRSFLTLSPLPTAVPCARLHARMVLLEWHMDDLAKTVELIVSELVTNARRASLRSDGQPGYENGLAGTPVVHLKLWSDRTRVVIEVWDQNPQPPTPKTAGPDDEHGRGLMLVEALCERWNWGTAANWPGKVVWAELRAE